MLVLTQVVDFIGSRQPPRLRPILGLLQPALLEIYVCFQGLDRAGIWYGGFDIKAPGFIQQDQRAFQVSPGFLEPGLGNPPAVRPVDQRGLLTQLSGFLQVFSSGDILPQFMVEQRQPEIMVRGDLLRILATACGKL